MFPLSPFARPVGSFQVPVTPPAPAGGSCSTLSVQFPSEWLPFIVGALQQLTLQSTWKGTDAEIIAAQQEAASIIGAIQKSVCVTNNDASGISCEEDMCCLRFQDGVLQMFSCGTWQDVPGQSGSGGLPGQPGTAPIPAPGTDQSYCFTMGPFDVRLLPAQVSTGDIITIQNPQGAWSGDSGLIWNCPSGWYYLLGGCVGPNEDTSLLTLLTSAPFGVIVAKIGANYYDVFNRDAQGNPQPFVVPAGIENAPVEFHGNFNPAFNLAFGQVSFCAEVQNNQTTAHVHVFDFTASPYSSIWSILHNGAFTPPDFGQWVAGSGYEAVYEQGSNGFRELVLQTSIGAHITDWKFVFTFTNGSTGGGADDAFSFSGTGGGTIDSVAPGGTPISPRTGHADHTTTDFQIVFNPGFQSGTGDPGGTAVLQRLELTIVGPDPY